MDMSELIPKLLHELNLETRIKNKVQEVLDKKGYFKDNSTVAAMKFRKCKDTSFLPPFFLEKEHEPLESVANAKKAWSEQIKQKFN
jgi:hypothetical protein